MISAVRRRRTLVVIVGVAVTTAWLGATGAHAARRVDLRLDQIQVIGTHNSYHLPPRSNLAATDLTNIAQAPLDVQLEVQNVRSFELDAYNGPNFDVFHGLITDDKSTCPTMGSCLDVIDEWSRHHRKHVPILILLEPKQLPTSTNVGVQRAIDTVAAAKGYKNWDAAGFNRLDKLVRTTFGKHLLTPDDVRGDYKTLREAVLDRGWPSLRKSLGKVVVVLNTGDPLRDVFIGRRTSLQSRAMFVTASGHAPSAAVIKRDDPDNLAGMRELVRQHFIVRTRADTDGIEARLNSSERSERALRSGAQIVSTDYPVPDLDVSPYMVGFPDGGPIRCNPVNAPKRCRNSDLPERPLRA
jgi:hypothetical protein